MDVTVPRFWLEIDKPHRLLVLHCQGFVASEVYREGLLEAVQVTRKEYLRNWVMDTKHMKVIRQVDQQWTMQSWFSQFKLLGVRRLGIVVSDDIFNQMAISGMVATLRPDFSGEVEYFQGYNSALFWAREGEGDFSDLGLFSV
ncbi:hypothetical protein [Rufibacter roseus]|uniref:STAS/SEC14 domain-containing protein n=1 Tax=Rufibacter roseus TaxID=1567108 RepID=A0ABW2DPB3_9BACT|nr:hypothetical protein [Rufibacter roseus]